MSVAPAAIGGVVVVRGRKPKPTALKVLQGNPGHRDLNGDEPQHTALAIADYPPELSTGRLEADTEARAEWDRVAGGLVISGQVTAVDRGLLVSYCVKYGQWFALEREAALTPFVVNTPAGHPIKNPGLVLANQTLGVMLRAAAELGITPSSRSRVTSVKTGAPANPLARFLSRAKG